MRGLHPLPRRILSVAAIAAVIVLALAGLYERWTGPDLAFRLRHLQILPHQDRPASAMAPLQPGDRLLNIDGEVLRRDHTALGRLASSARRGPVVVELMRDGERIERVLRFERAALDRRFNWTLRTLATILVFFIGFRVYSRRRDPLSRLFFILTLLMGSLIALDPRIPPGAGARLLELKGDLLALFLPPVWLHFLILFPERRARPFWLRLLIYLPPLLLALLVSAAILRDLPMDAETALPLLLQQVAGAVSAILLLTSLVVLSVKAFRRKRRREQRRIRLVLLASVLGLLPMAAFEVLHQLLPGRHLGLAAWTPLFLTLLPMSFAKGILGPDLPALNRSAVRIRRFLLSGGVLTLVFIGGRLGLHQLRGRIGGTLEDLVLDAIALSGAILLLAPLRRTFFSRMRGEEESPFRDCLKWLAPPTYFTNRQEMSRALLPRLGWDAKSAWALWLERDERGVWSVQDRWQREGGPARSISVPAPGSVFSLPIGLENALLGPRAFLAAEQWDPYWAHTMLGSEALPYCKDRDWALLLCLATSSENPTLLVLGPSSEGSLYEPDQIEGLHTLVSPLELHLRNLSLLSTAAREEQLRSEMELARSIQLSLLPRETPVLNDLELACRIQTSSEVGGDYYDFLDFDSRHLGLALGDATGHGVPAALLISTVASAFHTQAATRQRPAAVLDAMNRSLFRLVSNRSLQRGAFAGFVYALFERDQSLLRYCNGGMPAPWLLRADGSMERLHRGGHLLGFSEDHDYLQGVLKLHPGDLLFFRSDGVEDQENAIDGQFGEARLLEWLHERKDFNLERLSDQLMETLRQYSAGELDDDISFLFMRLAG